MAVTGKLKRKYMAHYIDSALPSGPVSYIRLGTDLEEYVVEMNANVNSIQNILNENVVSVDGYEPQASVEPYYAVVGDPLFNRLQKIADERLTLDDLKTSTIEVHLWEETSAGVFVAYKEDAIIEVVSYGGDQSGYQIPFNIHNTGNRVKGKFTVATNTFVADTGTLGLLTIEVIKGGTVTTTKVSDVVGETGNTLMYKVGPSVTTPYYDESSTGYTALTIGTAITTAAGHFIVVVAVSGGKVVAASPIVPVVVGA